MLIERYGKGFDPRAGKGDIELLDSSEELEGDQMKERAMKNQGVFQD